MNKAVKRIKCIAFVLLYIAIYYAASFSVSALYYKKNLLEGASLSTVQELARNNAYTLNIVVWIVCSLCYVIVGKLRKTPLDTVLKRNSAPPILFVMAISLAFGCRFLVTVYYSLSANVPILDESVKMAESALPNPVTTSQLMVALLSIVVLAPYFEELLFRGLIMNELLRIMRPWVAIILQAIVFGVMHGVLFQSIFAIAVGIMLGLIYYRTKNIRITVLFHGVFNFSSVLMQGNLPVSGLIIYSVAGVMLCVLSTFYICLNTKKDSWF